MATKRLPYWMKRYQEQGEKTVGNKVFDWEKFKSKSAQAANLLRNFLLKESLKSSATSLVWTRTRVLDYGCGIGRLSGILVPSPRMTEDALRIPRFYGEVEGLDIIPWAVEKAKENCPQGHFQIFDGITIPFIDGYFDAALSWTVLQHIPPDEVEEACSELGRVICEQGNLILYENTSTWEKDAEHIWFRSMEEYQRFFPLFNMVASQVIEKADDTPQEHSLMLFEKSEK